MPTLLEMQAAMRQSLVHRDSAAASAMLAAQVRAERLDIYRNTFLLTLTKALRLCFPVVQKLVGDEFFEGAAQVFIAGHPPRAAWLDQYGAEFPDFLRAFGPAASVRYLGDVAELEWAVNCALHAADAEPLDPAKLAAVATDDQRRIRLIANPSIALFPPESRSRPQLNPQETSIVPPHWPSISRWDGSAVLNWRRAQRNQCRPPQPEVTA